MSTVFVGRARELEALSALLNDARAGNGRLALLSGEPGIGKSRLAEEVARRAEANGFATAWGRSWEGAGTPAYWPWTQVLRRLSSLPELRASFADEVLRPLLAPEGSAAEAADAEHARFQLFDAVARALAGAVRVRPLLVVLDDLHAADAATLALLHFVARGLHGPALALIATSREAPFAGSGAAPELMARIGREARTFPLGRLARTELAEWLSSDAPELPPERIWAASEGNPLFVEELIAAERKRPGAAWTKSQMPLGIREAVRAHLVLLPEPAQVLLETASVLGREPTLRMLRAIASSVEREALDDAVASGVLLDVGDGRLRFSHMLLCDELYARLSPERRRALHREAARACAESAEAAHHALCAATPAHAPEVLAVVLRAMREASGRLAHEDAAALGRRALESIGPHVGGADACALEVAIAEALVTAGHLAEGQAMAERAAAVAAELGLGELLARAALTRAAELTFAHDESAARWLQRALDVLDPDDSSLRATVMARLSVALQNSPAAAREIRGLRNESIAMARRVGDEKALLGALYSASASHPAELGPRDRFALYAEAVALAERLGTVARVTPLLVWHVTSFLDVADPDGARAAADRVEALLAPFREPHHRWQLPLVRAVLTSVAGRFAEAERLAHESLAIAREHGLGEGLMMYCVFRTTLPYLRGDAEGLAEDLPLIDRTMGAAPLWSVFRALVDAPLGHVDRVRESFALLRTLPVAEVTGAGQLGWACVRAGLRDEAELFHGLGSAPTVAPLAWAPGGYGCVGPTSLLRGQLAAMTGRRDEAAEHLGPAVELARALRSPPMLAQTELEWAELLAPDDAAGAAEHARVALEQAESVGMDVIAARARSLAAGPARPREAPAPAGAPALRLSRQGELWVLEEGARRILLRDSKGMGYLEVLVQQPHRQVHVLELAGIDAAGDAGPVLDGKAKQAYRARAEELRAALEEAEAHGDLGRSERVREELDVLGGELARALGLGGRDRRLGSAAERARINIQRRLKDVVRRVTEQDDTLGRHLELSLKTGLFCMYAPTWPAG